jgi:hypothetical protein
MPEFKIIAREKDRTFYDYEISNDDFNAPIVLCGLCPGYTQLKNMLDNEDLNIVEARKSASFKGCTKNIAKMLRKIQLNKKLKINISDDYGFNSSKYFFTTSLVKYPGLRAGKGRSDDFNPLDYEFAKKCIKEIFLKEIIKGKSGVIIVFGKKAQKAV